jgi:hypothetical protein
VETVILLPALSVLCGGSAMATVESTNATAIAPMLNFPDWFFRTPRLLFHPRDDQPVAFPPCHWPISSPHGIAGITIPIRLFAYMFFLRTGPLCHFPVVLRQRALVCRAIQEDPDLNAHVDAVCAVVAPGSGDGRVLYLSGRGGGQGSDTIRSGRSAPSPRTLRLCVHALKTIIAEARRTQRCAEKTIS